MEDDMLTSRQKYPEKRAQDPTHAANGIGPRVAAVRAKDARVLRFELVNNNCEGFHRLISESTRRPA
jgi:hypothetical protein